MIHAVAESTPFLPTTLGGYASIVAALAAALAALLGARNRQHIQQVHVLVNGRMSRIESALHARTLERDRLQAEIAGRRKDDPPPPHPLRPAPEPEDPTS
jgi:hypothetical protein